MRNDSSQKNQQLLLIELNEVNFDIVKMYLDKFPGKFNALEKCMAGKLITTCSEDKYELLEPWIQWPTIHLGKTYDEHQIFRLGDIVRSNHVQIFEEIQNAGNKVGVLSAMNADNRLGTPAYFIPDPWTNTSSDSSFWSKRISEAVSQAVNDNASSKLTLSSAFYLLIAIVRFAKLKHYSMYLRLALGSRNSVWRKALFLDLFLHDLHLGLLRSKAPAFSTLFLNAGAHIQHHYFFNCLPIKENTNLRNPDWYVSEDQDPFREMLELYDLIIGELLELNGADVLLATALSQKPYDRVKYYYRLKDHIKFLDFLGIKFSAVSPRMTRDFLVEFSSEEEARVAEVRLRSVLVKDDDSALFGEIDNRGQSLFVTLTFPKEVTLETQFKVDGNSYSLAPAVAFVAIKNGMHQGKGFAFFSKNIEKHAPKDGANIKELNFSIRKYFGLTH